MTAVSRAFLSSDMLFRFVHYLRNASFVIVSAKVKNLSGFKKVSSKCVVR